MVILQRFLLAGALIGILAMPVNAQERQLTHSLKNHDLDGTKNFSGDDQFLCYDTRFLAGPGIDNSRSIEKVHVKTGEETLLYRPAEIVTGPEGQAAPGVGAPEDLGTDPSRRSCGVAGDGAAAAAR